MKHIARYMEISMFLASKLKLLISITKSDSGKQGKNKFMLSLRQVRITSKDIDNMEGANTGFRDVGYHF